jgi:mannose-6-phosphate isomerase-like protein (cupin superfamily)
MNMQKTTFVVLALWLGFATAADTPTLPATDFTHLDIQAFLNKLPPDKISDKPIHIVDVGGYRIGVFGVHRPKGLLQYANQHMYKMSEIYYILEGSGTLVTGGTMPDAKPMTPGSPNLQSPTVEGGVTRKVTKGDLVIIPGRTPHWWKSQDGDLNYLIIRTDPDSTMPVM